MKKLIYFAAIILLCVSCQKDDDGNRVSYYKTTGEGYIYDGKKNIPLKGATITVIACFEWKGLLFTSSSYDETYTTDENGFYQIRFLKRKNNDKVVQYLFKSGHGPMIPPGPEYEGVSMEGGIWLLYPDDIKDKKNMEFDTLKYFCDWDY